MASSFKKGTVFKVRDYMWGVTLSEANKSESEVLLIRVIGVDSEDCSVFKFKKQIGIPDEAKLVSDLALLPKEVSDIASAVTISI